MNKDEIIHELNNCLLTDEEFSLKPEEWEDFEDNFEAWEHQFESDDEEGEEGESKHKHDHKHHHHH